MSLTSIFEIYQLAHGPSLPYTTGALKVGQYFREVLIGVPYHQDNRIIVEFLGNFAEHGRASLSHMALVSGLAGYIPGENRLSLKQVYERIKKSRTLILMNKSWAFSVDSDLVTIRIHVLGPEEKLLLQAEYFVSVKGTVSGPGSRDSEASSSIDQIDSFSQIREVCLQQKLSLSAYVLSAEQIRHGIQQDQVVQHMINTWQIMSACINNGINNTGLLPDGSARQAHVLQKSLSLQTKHWKTLGVEQMWVNLYALAVAEEVIDNQLIITAPLCESAALVPAILFMVQEKFSVDENKISQGLLAGGIVGALLLKHQTQIYAKPILETAFSIATAMAAAAGMAVLSDSIERINQAAAIAVNLSQVNHSMNYQQLPELSLKYAGMALNAINLSFNDYQITELSFDDYSNKLFQSSH